MATEKQRAAARRNVKAAKSARSKRSLANMLGLPSDTGSEFVHVGGAARFGIQWRCRTTLPVLDAVQ